MRARPDYRGLEILITTGPGPVPRLDGLNPVIGRVESGMDAVIAAAAVPSFQPDARSQQLNRFAKMIGDERADNVRRQYGKPLRAIIISKAGVLAAGDAAAAAAAGSSVGSQPQGGGSGAMLTQEGARALAAGGLLPEVP